MYLYVFIVFDVHGFILLYKFPFFNTVMKIGTEALEEMIEYGQVFRVSEDEESD